MYLQGLAAYRLPESSMLSGKMQWLTFFFHDVANVNGQALASAAAAAGPVLLVMDVSSFGTLTGQPACIPSPPLLSKCEWAHLAWRAVPVA